jgi:flagellar biosynthetic protein FlhB
VSGGGEKTEKPTGRRLAKARRKGQVGRTPDLGAWLGLGAGVLTVPLAVRSAQGHLVPMLQAVSDVAKHPEPAVAMQSLAAAGVAIVPAVAPIAIVTVLVAVASSVAQGGFHMAWDLLKPNFSHLHLVKGVKRLFSPTQAWQLLKSLLKVAVIALVLWTTVRGLVPLLLSSDVLPLSSILGVVTTGTSSLIRTAVVAGLAIAAADYAVAKRKNIKDLRMTKQEVKEEHKSSEGNPQVKAAIRSKMRAMSRNRMMAAVATADVVLVNPTHVAVALRYDRDKGAPRVVAKGSGHVAAKIRERAKDSGVPMVADIPLARALYAACKLDQEIPEHLYLAVAQVLAFVMALRKRGAAAGIHRSPVAA